jgi:two-component system chemotaxis sensor kinase CheA
MRSFVVRFRTQAEETGVRISRAIVALERAADDPAAVASTYGDLARDLHALKGTAAMLALTGPAGVIHRMETLVLPHREARGPLPAPLADLLLEGIDAFVAAVRARSEGREEPTLSDVAEQMDRAAGVRASIAPSGGPPPATPPRSVAGGSERPNAEATEARGDSPAWLASWRVDASQVGALMREAERLREVCLRLDEHARELERSIEETRSGSAGMAETRWRLKSLKRGVVVTSREAADIAESFDEALKTLASMPTRTVLDPLHRAVRDLCRQHGKEATLSVVGAECSLDRRLLDTLGTTLTHLVRNAIDHGMESPAVRERAGKHHEGALVIRVVSQGNLVIVEVSDDGAGIDLARVGERALARGIVTPDALSRMSHDEIAQLVFHDGISTKEEVSETSGRGVGLSAVRRGIEEAGGHVEVWSKAGQGTRFVLTMAATLGSTPILVVRVGDHSVGFPLVSVEMARCARQEDLRVHASRVDFVHRGELLALHDVGARLGFREAQVPSHGQPLLVIQSEHGRAAILVDEIIGDRELVLRSLPRELRDIPAYQGVATLAHGEVILVCRPEWFVRRVEHSPGARPSRRLALVVDDSLTARALHRTSLEVGGFTVHTAASAAQALDRLAQAHYDLMVCDISMEDVDGIELTKLLRTRDATRLLPIVLVSVRDSEEDRRQGMAAGADAFLSKRDCATGRLLGEVAIVTQRPRAADGAA